MNAQTAIKPIDEFYVKTRAYMDERGIPADQYQQVRSYLLHMACKEECQPFIEMLTKVHLQFLPSQIFVNGPNGIEPVSTELQGDAKIAADNINEHIRSIQAKYQALAEQ